MKWDNVHNVSARDVCIQQQGCFLPLFHAPTSSGSKDSLSLVILNSVALLLLRFHSMFSFIILRNTITCRFWHLPLGRQWHLFLVVDHFHNWLFTFTEYSGVCSVWNCEAPQWFHAELREASVGPWGARRAPTEKFLLLFHSEGTAEKRWEGCLLKCGLQRQGGNENEVRMWCSSLWAQDT